MYKIILKPYFCDIQNTEKVPVQLNLLFYSYGFYGCNV